MKLQFALMPAILAGILWGSWAFYINRESNQAIESAIAQSIASFFLTSYISFSTALVAKHFNQRIAKITVSSLFTGVQVTLMLSFLHNYVGTENVIETIIGPIIIGTSYSAVFCYFLTLGKLKPDLT